MVLEVGPNPVLSRMARPWVGSGRVAAWCASLDRQGGIGDVAAIEKAAKLLDEHLDHTPQAALSAFERVFPNRKAFPWQTPPHPFLQQTQAIEGDGVTRHKAVFHEALMNVYQDFTFEGRCIFPGAGYFEMVTAALSAHISDFDRKTSKALAITFRDVSIREPLDMVVGTSLICEVPTDVNLRLAKALNPKFYRPGQSDRVLCSMQCSIDHLPHDEAILTSSMKAFKFGATLSEVQAHCAVEVHGVSERYAELAAHGTFGPQFQLVSQVWSNDVGDQAVGRIRVPVELHDERYDTHPAISECGLHVAMFGTLARDEGQKMWVNTGIRSVTSRIGARIVNSNKLGDRWVWMSARVVKSTENFVVWDFTTYDSTGGVASLAEGGHHVPLKPQPPSAVKSLAEGGRRSKRPKGSRQYQKKQAVEKVDRLPIYPFPIDGLLVCFQPGDSGTTAPIVICIGLLGWIQGRGFIKLFPSSQPIYAMQAPELSSGDAQPLTIKERAWKFFKVLRRNFPNTGVHLFGGSYGGPLSAEIALFFQQAHIPFTLMMHDPLPAIAAPVATEDVARRARDYRFIFSILSHTKQLTEQTRAKVVNTESTWFDETAKRSQSVKELDQAVKHLLDVDDGVFDGLVQTMSVIATARLSLSTLKPQEVIQAPVTIFTMSEGGAFFAEFFGYLPGSCVSSNGYGWSSYIAAANIVQLQGGHLDGLGNEEAIAAVSEHLQRLVMAEPLLYNPVRVEKSTDSVVTRIELLSNTVTDHMMHEILAAVEPGRLHVFTSACSDFCVGRPARAGVETEAFVDGIQESAKLLRALDARCDLPIVTLCRGATRGVGMVFAAVSDVVVATSDATFVLAETADGAVPGVATIALARRLSEQQYDQWAQSGDTFNADVAREYGLVNTISPTYAEAWQKLECMIESLGNTSAGVLRAWKTISRSGGNLAVASVEIGKALIAASPVTNSMSSSLVRTQWRDNRVAVVELFDPEGKTFAALALRLLCGSYTSSPGPCPCFPGR